MSRSDRERFLRAAFLGAPHVRKGGPELEKLEADHRSAAARWKKSVAARELESKPERERLHSLLGELAYLNNLRYAHRETSAFVFTADHERSGFVTIRLPAPWSPPHLEELAYVYPWREFRNDPFKPRGHTNLTTGGGTFQPEPHSILTRMHDQLRQLTSPILPTIVEAGELRGTPYLVLNEGRPARDSVRSLNQQAHAIAQELARLAASGALPTHGNILLRESDDGALMLPPPAWIDYDARGAPSRYICSDVQAPLGPNDAVGLFTAVLLHRVRGRHPLVHNYVNYEDRKLGPLLEPLVRAARVKGSLFGQLPRVRPPSWEGVHPDWDPMFLRTLGVEVSGNGFEPPLVMSRAATLIEVGDFLLRADYRRSVHQHF